MKSNKLFANCYVSNGHNFSLSQKKCENPSILTKTMSVISHSKVISDKPLNKTNDPILNLTPENITQHSGIE